MLEKEYKSNGSSSALNANGIDVAFAERFIEMCQDAFVPIYVKVSQKFWNNAVYANVRRPYYMCNHNLGVAEYYIPTVLNGEGIMQYHRIAFLVLPELEKEIYEGEFGRLMKPLSQPMGRIDSTTIFIVAPKCTQRHKLRVWIEKFKAMLKIRRFGTTFIVPIVSPVVDIAFKKVMGHLKNFWEKRVKAFVEKLKLCPWQFDYKVRNLLSSTLRVLENYDRQIKHCLESMVDHFMYMENCFLEAKKCIGGLNVLKMKVLDTAKMIADGLDVLPQRQRLRVYNQLLQCLTITA